jgi:mono/diheme cytochrome c family protein
MLKALLCVSIIAASSVSILSQSSPKASLLQKTSPSRHSTTDLAIGGDLQGLSKETRYLSREDLLALPQVTYTVSDDTNFKGPTTITGVLLETLVESLAHDPNEALVVAICDDQYHAHYMQAYLAAHHPVLVLKVNGEPPDRWPKDAESHGLDMGPYMISHQSFTPTFKILAHNDEPQIPWGVSGLEFRNEEKFLKAIAPPRNASDALVQNGYRIAQQNCLRCHNHGDVGGLKAAHPWLVLSAWATASRDHFAAYVRNPKANNPVAQMPPNSNYDDATIKALASYFQTFQSQEKQ